MQMDTALNLTALVVPPVLSYWVILGTLRGLRALEHRRWLASLGRQPFRLRELPPVDRAEGSGLSGLTPDEWYANLANDAVKGLRKKAPSWLDYLREFHPETLGRSTRRPRGHRLRRITRLIRR